MLRGGIPHWHLPENVLNAEVTKIEDLGDIEIKCNTRVGEDVSWDDLKSYDAAFLAVGQDVGRKLPVEGNDLRGVMGGLEFVREAGFNKPVKVGKKVIVVGGGNTASDTARSALRLGAEEVTIVSLEGPDELIIVDEDLEHAKAEGVQFKTNTACARASWARTESSPAPCFARPICPRTKRATSRRRWTPTPSTKCHATTS